MNNDLIQELQDDLGLVTTDEKKGGEVLRSIAGYLWPHLKPGKGGRWDRNALTDEQYEVLRYIGRIVRNEEIRQETV